MSKNQTMKKVAMAVVAANVVASSLITTMPAKSMAAENDGSTSVGNQAETKLKSGLTATQNLVKNAALTDLAYWVFEKSGTSSVTPNGDGSVTINSTASSAGYLSQKIDTIPGHTYRLTVTATNVSNAQYAIFLGATASTVGSISGDWRYFTGTQNITLNTTATGVKTVVGFQSTPHTEANGIFKFSNVKVVDTSVLDQTTISDISTNTTTVSGKGEPNGAVLIKNGDVQIGSGKVNSNGDYSVTIPEQAYGSTITATVMSGTLSSSANQTVTQAPIAAPTINPLTTKSTTASGTGEAGSTLTFKANGIEYPTTVTSDGTWSVTIPKQAANAVVEATSVLNSVSSAKATETVSYEGPNTPVLDNVTNTSTRVTGTGDPGNTITVKVKPSNISYSGTVDVLGEFSINIDTPDAGATVEAVAQDSTGTISPKATKTVLDVIAPDAPSVNAVKDTDTVISGTGEANCDVAVKLPSGGIIEGRTNSEGAFSITIPKQAVGANIEVSLTDAAGNKGTATTVTVQADTLANPTVNRVSNQDTKVTGTGVAGATVNVQANNTTYTDTVKTDGTYEVTVPKLAAGTSVSVEQTKSGVTSGSVTTIVQDDAVPSAPTVNAVKDTDTVVTGTATAGNLVSVKIGDGNYSAVVAANGTYSITIPAQASGTKISVTAKNTANDKVSTATQVTVTDTTLGAPAIDAVNTASTNVTVTGEKGALISVRLPDGTVLTKVADNTGKAVISIPKQTA
ncbi:hypothetical protein HCA73_06905, partial [Listeria booriae]|uniref:Ig-like domain-containing protein n=1 Tax=Listeria booriae TaxID=1552123 RepID=UPI00185C1E8F